MIHLDVDQAYAAADLMGLSGFDLDMDLEPYQNLDMAVNGFSSNGNQWDENSLGSNGIKSWPSLEQINSEVDAILAEELAP
jgi:hypothetical protein